MNPFLLLKQIFDLPDISNGYGYGLPFYKDRILKIIDTLDIDIPSNLKWHISRDNCIRLVDKTSIRCGKTIIKIQPDAYNNLIINVDYRIGITHDTYLDIHNMLKNPKYKLIHICKDIYKYRGEN